MNPDLQKLMEQRRRKSESKGENASEVLSHPAFSPTKKELSKVSMGQDLQAIMARRRKMAGDASEDEDEKPPASRPMKNDTSEKANNPAKLSTHLDQKGDPGRRRRTTDGESTVSGSLASKSVERRSRRKPRNNGDEGNDPSERRKSSSRRSKSGDSDELSVDQSVSSRRRRSSDDDTISSGRKGRRSDDKKLPPISAGSSIPGMGTSSDDERDEKLRRKKLAGRSSSSGEDEPVTKNKKNRSKPSSGQSIVDGTSTESLKSMKESKGATSGWDDFPAFGGTEGFASGGVKNNDDGFGSFPADGNFSTTNNTDTTLGAFDFPMLSNHQLDGGKSLSKKDFDVAFSSTAFDNGPTFEAFDSKSTTAFDVTFPRMGTSGFSTLPVVEEAAPQKVWDKSPLVGDLPSRSLQRPELSQEAVMSAGLYVPPVSNPSNGNIICCNEKNGILKLIETDPKRGNLQVLSTTIMSHEFRQNILSKHNMLVHKVEDIVALTAGLHHTNGQTRTRVAAMLDLLVLESNQVLRVVAVWQWGYGTTQPVTLQYTISPPSGGDFSFEPNTLRNTDGLLFIAGAAPKGPCIFICKPSVKETWSANFIGENRRVSCITVSSTLHRMYPYLVIAMDDGSISMWTYKSALLPLSSKESLSASRWLFPVCRLEHSAIFSSIESSSIRNKGVAVVTGESLNL